MESGPELRPDPNPDLKRFVPQMALSGFGREGQEKISRSAVLVIGAGGLGCPALQYLAAAGIGRIGIFDFDTVSESNLSRQILYGVEDLGLPKVDVAARMLKRLAPSMQLVSWNRRFTTEMTSVVSEFDLVLDCSDRFTTRFDLSAACGEADRVLVTAAAERMGGLVGVFRPAVGSCYGCATAGASEASDLGGIAACEERGILGPVTGILGSWAAAEALRWVVYGESPILGKLLHVDLERNRTVTLAVDRHARCPFHSVGRESQALSWIARRELPAGARVYDLASDTTTPATGTLSWPYEKWLAGEFPTEVTAKVPEGETVLYCPRSQRSYIVASLLGRKGIRSHILQD